MKTIKLPTFIFTLYMGLGALTMQSSCTSQLFGSHTCRTPQNQCPKKHIVNNEALDGNKGSLNRMKKKTIKDT